MQRAFEPRPSEQGIWEDVEEFEQEIDKHEGHKQANDKEGVTRAAAKPQEQDGLGGERRGGGVPEKGEEEEDDEEDDDLQKTLNDPLTSGESSLV
jgi:hypothetical protein